ncbi:uncharacterized protein [Montipora foliosa]|uniref:uncharacterized protein n=1 Tax=Montipora foliosa TaxID=591990 RepID=UPI0035F1E9C1
MTYGQRHKTNVSKAWMKLLFSRIGDKMPDSLAINLPSYLDYRILYGWMKQDLTGEEMICYSQFCRIMNSDFPDVSIPKVNRVTKCDICTSLKEEKQKTMDKTLRAYYDNLYKQHNDLQREEREKYYYHRGKARDAMSSKSYMCLIIDGMDQKKLLIPSLINQAKSYGRAWRLKTHLTGFCLNIHNRSDKVPRGLPETVPPSSEKIDLKRLREDIPKFYSSRCFNQSHKEWWDDFLSDKEGVYATPEDASTWLLDDIIVIRKRPHEPRSVDLAGAMISPVVEKSSAETAIEKLVADQLVDIPEVYAGAYKNPRVISSRVNKVTDHLSALKEDVFVAVNIEGYQKIPVLGKVRSVDASTFELEYWRGTWKTEWKPWKLSNGDTWTDILPKSCILLVAFVFDEKNKLPHETYKYLKETYKTLRGRRE